MQNLLLRNALLSSRQSLRLVQRAPAAFTAQIEFRRSNARSYATSTTPSSSSIDPQEQEAQKLLNEGTLALELGDLALAFKHYSQSIAVKETAIAYYNLGVVQYSQSDLPASIASFLLSLELSTPTTPEPASYPPTPAQLVRADTHTNLGAAYILSTPPRPDLALMHLQDALEISPDSGEICYNLAAVLEASGEEEEALVAYGRARVLGIERAAVNERNIGAKLLGKRRVEEENAANAKATEDPKQE